jgi:hypothetical protein
LRDIEPPEERGGAALLLRSMLYDIPITVNLTKLSVLHRQARTARAHPEPAAATAGHPVNLCAGWVADSIMRRSVTAGRGALLHDGVQAPALPDPHDPAGWHELPSLPADGYRRWRRMDVSPPKAPRDAFAVEGMFRDSYYDELATEHIEHEYSFEATVDPAAMILASCTAAPRVLPAPDCTFAAPSAGGLTGAHLDDVPALVHDRLVGAGSCTHLSDTLVGLGDVGHLIDVLGTRITPASGR